jgi:hypothetical protein
MNEERDALFFFCGVKRTNRCGGELTLELFFEKNLLQTFT